MICNVYLFQDNIVKLNERLLIMERLTKERAIELHRDMWNWIASELNKNPDAEVHNLKNKYIKTNPDIHKYQEYNDNEDLVHNNCFCCEYAVQQANPRIFANDFDFWKEFNTDFCEHCPLIWGTEDNTEDFFCETGIEHNFEALDGKETTGLWNLINNAKEINLTPEEKINIARQIANLPEKR